MHGSGGSPFKDQRLYHLSVLGCWAHCVITRGPPEDAHKVVTQLGLVVNCEKS